MPVTQINGIQNCQPLKPVMPAQPIREAVSFKNANLASSNGTSDKAETLNIKYDIACRLAAYNAELASINNARANYYQTKYEALCKNGSCLA